MRFQLAGLIAEKDVLRAISADRLPAIALDGRLCFTPLARTLAQARLGLIDPPIAGFKHLGASLCERARIASTLGPVAFVEADFVDALGNQAAIAWGGGEITLGPVHEGHLTGRVVPPIAEWPVNKALGFLGVVAGRGLDRFDTLRLGRHHRTELWIEAEPRSPGGASARL